MAKMESWGFLPLVWRIVGGTVVEIDRSSSLRLVKVIWSAEVMVVAQGSAVDLV